LRTSAASKKSLPAKRIKRIHVNQKNLRANRKDGGHRPLITIQTSAGPVYADHVDIKGVSALVSRPDKPLPCGARIWIETRAQVNYTRRKSHG
jgi:hypothetical protein